MVARQFPGMRRSGKKGSRLLIRARAKSTIAWILRDPDGAAWQRGTNDFYVWPAAGAGVSG